MASGAYQGRLLPQILIQQEGDSFRDWPGVQRGCVRSRIDDIQVEASMTMMSRILPTVCLARSRTLRPLQDLSHGGRNTRYYLVKAEWVPGDSNPEPTG